MQPMSSSSSACLIADLTAVVVVFLCFWSPFKADRFEKAVSKSPPIVPFNWDLFKNWINFQSLIDETIIYTCCCAWWHVRVCVRLNRIRWIRFNEQNGIEHFRQHGLIVIHLAVCLGLHECKPMKKKPTEPSRFCNTKHKGAPIKKAKSPL